MRDPNYWAGLDSEALVEKLASKVQDYDKCTLVGSYASRCARAYQYYFGQDSGGSHTTSLVLRGGQQGELAEVRVNHSRPLVNTLLNLIVAPKIVWTPKATNIDYDSLKECKLASAVLEYYWTEKSVSMFSVRALEEALVFSEGFVLVEWDQAGGEDLMADPLSGQIEKSGDAKFTNVSTWNVLRDPEKPSWEELDWVIVRLRKNRYDLMAKYGKELSEQILNEPEDTSFTQKIKSTYSETDDIDCFYFFHKRTSALPDGRAVVFLNSGTALEDKPLRYESIPLYRVSAGETFGTPFGYTAFYDILGVQELMDSLHTSIASNQSTFATQCIVLPQGGEVDIDHIAGGMRAIYVPPGVEPPHALNLTQTPGEVFAHLKNLKNDQELLLGLNSVVRGEPQSGEQSGSALALLQSQALQQSSTIQANYIRFVEGLGNCLLYTIKQNLSAEVKVAIAGKASQFLVEDASYSKESFTRIKRVHVEIGNPLSQSAAGRSEIAKDLMNIGLVKTPEQYQQILETGRLEPLTQSLSHELLLIRSENEEMARGEAPPVLALDDHQLHAREHRVLLANPQARRNPTIVQTVLAHIDEHEQQFYSTSPSTLMLVGQQPPQQPLPPPPGTPPGEVLAPPGNPEAGTPQQPSFPTNPATGEKFQPPS